MLLKDAMADKNIKAIRLSNWADPKSHLLLPRWIDLFNCRGIWFKLYDNGTVNDISVIQLNEKTDDNPNWEIYEKGTVNEGN